MASSPQLLVAPWLANRRHPVNLSDAEFTVAELTAKYGRHVASDYVKNGRPTDEQNCIRAALRPFLKLYENEPAASSN
ncbi:MAG TPA: hypothetical protein VGK58_16020 [Lacipirellulaceae bacterium]